MVLKRRLPSRLTQNAQTETEQDEVASSPDVFEDAIVTEELKDPSPKVMETSSLQDVYSEEDETAPKTETSPMKRKVKNRRERGQGIAKMKEQVLASKNITEKTENHNTLDEDLAPVSARPDAEETLSSSMADLKGELTNPAEDDIEAAYVSPSAEIKPEPAPDFDLSKIQKEPEPKLVEDISKSDNFPEPTPIESDNTEHFAPADIAAPQSFAEIEPKVEDTKPELDVPVPPSLAEETKADIKAESNSPNWDFGEFSVETPSSSASENSSPPIAPEIGDPYKDVGAHTPPELPTDNTSPELPPELPKTPAASIAGTLRAPSGGIIKLFVLVAAVLLIVVMVVVVRSGDKTRAGIKKFSDSYADVQKDIPTESEISQLESEISAEMGDTMAKLQMASLPLKGSAEKLGMDASKFSSTSANKSNTKVDFVDVTANEAAKPVTTNNTDMPEDIGAIARLQREITRLKSGKNPPETKQSATTEANVGVMSKQALDAELASYRKALMQSDGINSPVPRPSDFGTKKSQTDLNEVTTESTNGLPPNTRYLENPYELPVIAEPEGSSIPQIRTLNDFELALTAPEKDHVRIPRGVKPRMSATDFPEMEVLSFIPDKGIIATNKGMQGVLLIGEIIEGWELVSVFKGYAEFMNGKRKRVVTWD